MPVEVSWHEEGHSIYTRFYGDVTFDDLNLSAQISNDMAEETPHPVHLIVDLSSLERYPTQISQFSDTVQMWKGNRRKGIVVIVGAKGMARFIVKVIVQVAQHELRMVDTIADADAIVKRVIA